MKKYVFSRIISYYKQLSYIRAVLTFLGVPSVESVIAEGMAQTPDKAEDIKAKAIDRAKQVARSF